MLLMGPSRAEVKGWTGVGTSTYLVCAVSAVQFNVTVSPSWISLSSIILPGEGVISNRVSIHGSTPTWRVTWINKQAAINKMYYKSTQWIRFLRKELKKTHAGSAKEASSAKKQQKPTTTAKGTHITSKQMHRYRRKQQRPITIATINVAALMGRRRELIVLLKSGRVDIVWIPESKWKDAKSWQICDGYKLLH